MVVGATAEKIADDSYGLRETKFPWPIRDKESTDLAGLQRRLLA